MVGGLAACCANAMSGQAAAAPPNSVMKSRRLSAAPKHHDRPSYWIVYSAIVCRGTAW